MATEAASVRPTPEQGAPDPIASFPPLNSFPGALREGGPEADSYQRLQEAQAEALSEAESAALLARMEPLPVDAEDQQAFALRPGSQPPPRTGAEVLAEFPSAEQRQLPRVAPPEGPLQVLRYAPEGEVTIAGQISISFDRPMVAVTSHDDSVADVPLQIQPEVPGQWRWVGTRTLLFEPEGPRLPMATVFRMQVPAGTRSADGATLTTAVDWQFSTPALVLEQTYPLGAGVARDPLIFLRFNQRVVAADLLPVLSLRGPRTQTLPALRLATEQEIAADPWVSALIGQSEPQRWLVLRPQAELPAETAIDVVLAAGAPSAEGPLRTSSEQRGSFVTYGSFRVTEHRCGWRDCSPGDNFSFTLSNELELVDDIESLVEVEPSFPGMRVHAMGNQLSIGGSKPGRRQYTVRLSSRLSDRFGQGLEGEREFRFQVGAGPVSLMTRGDNLITVDPYGAPRYVFHSSNLASVRLVVHRVQPGDWPAYMDLQAHGRGEQAGALPGTMVHDAELRIDGQPDSLVSTDLDLAPWLASAGKGHLLVLLQAASAMPGATLPDYPQRSLVWLQVTDIGIDAVFDGSDLRVWSTALKDGSTLRNASVTLHPDGSQQTSDAEGMVKLPLPGTAPRDRGLQWLEVRVGDDVAFLPRSWHYWSGAAWQQRSEQDQLRWHVFDDRKMYRPGERVHLRGWLRVIENRPTGGLRLPERQSTVSWQVRDSRGNTLQEGETPLAGLGGFDLAFELPGTPNLGPARVSLRLKDDASGVGGASHEHVFEIQEFRTPEFEVTASLPAAPAMAGQTLAAQANASYYAGGPLPGAEVNWLVSMVPGYYSPPGHSEWSFGFRMPWWMHGGEFGDTVSAHLNGLTDAGGSHDLAIELGRIEQARAMSLTATASVQDVNRQTWSASASTLVHAAAVYVGMRTESYFVERGQPMQVDLLLVDIDGQPLADHALELQAGRIDWVRRGGSYQQQVRDAQICQVRSDEQGLARCEVNTDVGGQYQITAISSDDQGRRNATRIVRWVSGGSVRPADGMELEELVFVPDKDEYAPGDVARILVQAPFPDAQGLLVLGRHGVLEQRRFRISGSSTTLEIPIRREWMPNAELSVIVVGASARDGDDLASQPPRPAQAVGTLMLRVSTAERVLGVDVSPAQSALAPGATTSVHVRVSDAEGKPVAGAELALLVVDEAILGLSNYQLGNPLDIFYQLRPSGVSAHHLRPTLSLHAAPDEQDMQADDGFGGAMIAQETMAMAPPSPMMARGGAPEEPAAAIAVRSDFNPLAAFVPRLTSDANGEVSSELRVPDNLTRYRIMVVAVHDATHYGIGESTLTARLPLMVRPSPPRFLNFGDRFEFPVVLQNQTDQALDVQVAMDVGNLQLTAARGYALSVPANERVELRFPMAAMEAGTARYQLAAASSGWADAARGQLPVWTPATSEAFASYGVIDQGALLQPVAMPGEVWPQFGGLSISTTSTALHSLTDAFLYLHEYPFECSEQLASRIIATAALRDVLQAFEVPDLPTPEAIAQRVQADLQRLESLQNSDGGFGLWRSGTESWPYASLHAIHALLRAADKGYSGNPRSYALAMRYLGNIEQRIPAAYGEHTRRHVVAYSLYLRALNGEPDRARARALIAEVDRLEDFSLESLGWLLSVLSGDPQSADEVSRLRRFLANRVSETAAGAQFVTDWRDGDHLIMHSSRRADAVILEAMIGDQPDSDLIPKLVHALQAHRVRGRWGNTQENVFVLLALDRYFARFEAQTPDFVARTWLGQDFAGEHPFRGRSTERHRIDIPMAWLARGDGEQDLLLDKDGPGRLYYRIGLDYAPRSLQLEPARHGFEVQREYQAVDDPEDVRRHEDGSWEIRAGARVAVELTLVAPARRHHVALIDPLPAGLEAINPALAVSDALPTDSTPAARGRWWWGPWYEHQNLRDERAEAFTSLLPGGVYTWRYYARATTPGEFVVPPARAEEMYEPETFGRSGSDRVRVMLP